MQMHVLVLHMAPASVPHHRPRFVPSCQFFSKLQRRSQLTQFCQNDPHLLNHLRSHSSRAMAGGPGVQQPSGSRSSNGAPAGPEPSIPEPAGTRAVPRDSCQPGAWQELPSLPPPFAPTCKECDSILRVPLSNIRTLDQMLLFLSLLISSSSFNCSREAFSKLVAGIILSFP